MTERAYNSTKELYHGILLNIKEGPTQTENLCQDLIY